MSLRIGLIGCGRWGRMILPDLIALDARVCVAAPSEATRQDALDAGAVCVSPDIAALPKDVDGYVVATPTASHAAVIEELLASGKPSLSRSRWPTTLPPRAVWSSGPGNASS